MSKNWIYKDRSPKMSILLSKDASDQEEYAARELKSYLDLMGTVSIPIIRADEGENVIALGRAASFLGLEHDESLGLDAFRISSKEGNLGIVGGKRGIIYGVYELLEGFGCRFFTPECEKVPFKESLELPSIDKSISPVLEYRYHDYRDFTKYPRYAVKNRINGPTPIKEEFGGNLDYVWFVHSFEPHILDSEEWFDKHPEYFSMVDGKRLKERTQLCLTNPDVLRITIDKVKEALRENPNKKIISVSQNDWYNNCTCPDCKKIDEEEESSAGSLINFVNQVAEAIEPEFPDVIVDTLAYQYSRPAPKNIRPRHNVCVRLCSIEACFAHSFETCDDLSRQVTRPDGSKSDFITDLRDWAKVCDRMYIWDYTTCFAYYSAPFPNWRVLQPNMKSFIENNVKGVFEQACRAEGGGADLNELRAYLIGKLLWDADCDFDGHMKDFTDYYYGKAGPYIIEYINALVDKAERDNIHVGFNDNTAKDYLTEDMLDIYDSIFDRAEEAVKADPIRSMRVAKARLPIRWVRIKNDAMLKDEKDPIIINQFFKDWRAHGLTRLEEWVNAETTHRALVEGKWRGADFYQDWWEEGEENR